ncbi:MAG: MarR family transcriptional regulator [Thermoleophilia bacterium]|nr:MarR family transcriptional regulator [Thermoleophilia bacterium]
MAQAATTLPDPTDTRAIITLLFRVSTAFDSYTAQMRRALSLNAHERLALAALWSQGPLTMTELGSWIPLSRAAVTTLVDRMEDAGIVIRGSDPKDRRRTVVRLADDDMSRMHPVVMPWIEDASALCGEYDADQWRTIVDFLQRFNLHNERHANRLAEFSDDDLQALAQVPA